MKGKHLIKVGSVFLLMVTLILSTVTMAFAAENGDKWVEKAPMPTAKYFFETAFLNGKVYAMGGESSPELDEYDLSSDKWTVKAPMSVKDRVNFKTEIIDGKIYVIGGDTTSVEKYDPSTNQWTNAASMSTSRRFLQTVVIDGKIYAIGGEDNNFANLASMEVYDPATDKWTNKASMSIARNCFQVEVLNGKIYAMGGGNSTVEEYDPSTDKWTKKADMKTAMSDFNAEQVNGKIYAICGGHIEEYSPEDDKWAVKTTSTVSNRAYPQTCVVNGSIYLIGGKVDTAYSDSVEVFNPKTNSWATKTSMPEPTQYHRAIVYNGRIYSFGGGHQTKEGGITNKSVSTYEYTPDTNPTLTVTASTNKVKVGQQFTTDVAIHNETNICAEDMKITYDKDLFEYEGATGQTGTKIYKEDTATPGTVRFITACQGKDNAATGDKGLITLKFKAKAKGVGKVDIIKGRIADNATLEEDVADENCGEDTITVEGYQDVNRTGNFTLLDLGIDAYYDGMNASDTDSTKYDADVIPDGKIDDNDLAQITQEILANKDYAPNN